MKKLLLIILLLSSVIGFPQLAETNITTTLVGNTIGNASRNVGVLCTAPTINKWSRYKPVDKTLYYGASDWGLNIGIESNTISQFLLGDWTYRDRVAGIDTPDNLLGGFRLGQFRQYLHTAVAPVSGGLFPSGETYADFVSFGSPTILVTNANGITLSEIITPSIATGKAWEGATAWYFGIRLEKNGNYIYGMSVTDIQPNGAETAIAGFTFSFADIAFNGWGMGVYNYKTFLTPVYDAAIGATQAGLLAGQTTYPILEIPNGSGYFTRILPPSAAVFFILPQTTEISNAIGTIAIDSDAVEYYITNGTAGDVAITMAWEARDASNVLLKSGTIQLTITTADDGTLMRTYLTKIIAADNYTYTFTITID